MGLAGRGGRGEGFPPLPAAGGGGRVPPPALMVVDHLEDAHNLGAIARSVEAAGLAGLVVPGRRGVPLGPAAFKAAAGALERIGVTVGSSIAAGIRELEA